jgi:NAD(P)-dependent dehydrogenase (short-subunit alcohol dehydrogenase family)
MFNYRIPANLLSGKIILVTDATQEIGYTASVEYAKYGATVIILGNDLEKLEVLYDEIVNFGYPEPVIHRIDFLNCKQQDYQEVANSITTNFDALDGLLLTNEYLAELRPLLQTPEQQWLASFQINVHSCFFMCKHLLAIMRKSNNASIILNSHDVSKGRAYWGAYSATKAAIESLMYTLADEEDGVSSVRANCINPGAVRTKIRAQAYPLEDTLSLATAEDIMPAYIYLMGNDSINTSGKIIHAQHKNYGS